MYGKKASLYCDYFAGREDIPFFRRLVLSTGGPVLNLGCGTGALALDLAGAGLEVVGVDSSPYMLDIARDKADKLPPSAGELHLSREICRFPGEQFAILLAGQFRPPPQQ